MRDEVIDTSYEPFSREPEYIEANRAFLSGIELAPAMRILDLACGTGTMTDLIRRQIASLEGLVKHRPVEADGGSGLLVVGLDLSWESLSLARQLVSGEHTFVGNNHAICLIEGTADCLPIIDRTFDFIVMGNAIQLIPDRDIFFREIHRVLRPGGLFAFNTSFYAGTYVPGTEHVYTRWIQEALVYIRARDAELRAAGLPGMSRKRGLAARAFSRPWLSSAEYSQEMECHGLVTRSIAERTVMLTQRSFETIGAYAGLASVLLSGYPIRLACEALQKAAGPTLAALELKAVPRYWLEMVSEKTTP